MKKIFIGQAVTGQDMKVLNSEMEKIYDVFSQKGLKPYSTLEEEGKNNFKNAGDWVRHAFKVIDSQDIYIAIIRNENKSEGLLMEVGCVLSQKKRFVLAIKDDVKKTYLRDMTDEVIEWKTFEDLLIKLKKLKI
jgi:hypothetical protein